MPNIHEIIRDHVSLSISCVVLWCNGSLESTGAGWNAV